MLTMADLDRLEELTIFRSEGDAKTVGELVQMARRSELLTEIREFLIDMHMQSPERTVEESQRLLAKIDSASNSQRKEGGEG